jgi:hypothetical protein
VYVHMFTTVVFRVYVRATLCARVYVLSPAIHWIRAFVNVSFASVSLRNLLA